MKEKEEKEEEKERENAKLISDFAIENHFYLYN
jgi:hypothetical protein